LSYYENRITHLVIKVKLLSGWFILGKYMTIILNENKNEVLSPCIKNCCLDTSDICVGCYRSLSEIVGWRDKSKSQKLVILARCEQRKNQLSTRE